MKSDDNSDSEDADDSQLIIVTTSNISSQIQCEMQNDDLNNLYSDGIIENLWKSKAMGNYGPEEILVSVWFYISHYFGISSRTDHAKLCLGNIIVDKEGPIKKMLFNRSFNSHNTGNPTGTSSNGSRAVFNTRFVPKTIYETPNAKDKCPLTIFETYLSHRPSNFCYPSAPLYLQPDKSVSLDYDGPWFAAAGLGKNRIGALFNVALSKSGRPTIRHYNSRRQIIGDAGSKLSPTPGNATVTPVHCGTTNSSTGHIGTASLLTVPGGTVTTLTTIQPAITNLVTPPTATGCTMNSAPQPIVESSPKIKLRICHLSSGNPTVVTPSHLTTSLTTGATSNGSSDEHAVHQMKKQTKMIGSGGSGGGGGKSSSSSWRKRSSDRSVVDHNFGVTSVNENSQPISDRLDHSLIKTCFEMKGEPKTELIDVAVDKFDFTHKKFSIRPPKRSLWSLQKSIVNITSRESNPIARQIMMHLSMSKDSLTMSAPPDSSAKGSTGNKARTDGNSGNISNCNSSRLLRSNVKLHQLHLPLWPSIDKFCDSELQRYMKYSFDDSDHRNVQSGDID